MKIIEDNPNFTLYEGNIKVFKPSIIIGIENITFGKNILIDSFTQIYAKEKGQVKIGNYVHFGAYSSIMGGGTLTINDYVAVSQGCRIVTATDDFKNGGFGTPCMPNNEKYRNVTHGNITIGKFAIIGTNSVILPNVTIEEGVTVGAGCVIGSNKTLKEWGVYVGSRRVGERNKQKCLENYNNFLKESDYENKNTSYMACS